MNRTFSAMLFAAAGTALLAPAGRATAADPTTAECLSANDKSISLRNEHKLLSARAQSLVCAASTCPADIRKECVRRIDLVNASVPTVVFEAKDGAGNDLSAVTVKMDGDLLAERLEGTAISLDPGAHTFTFEAAGQPLITKQLVVREGQKDRREAIQFGAPVESPAKPAAQVTTIAGPTAPAAPSGEAAKSGGDTQKLLGYGAMGLGVVGVAVGAIFGLQSMSKHNDAKQACPSACADEAGVTLWDDARSAGNISTIGFVVGGLGVAGGAILLLTAKPSSGSNVQVGLGPTSLRVGGTW
jgi:hypothetical protein